MRGAASASAEIRDEFDTIHAMQDSKGEDADFFEAFTQLILSQGEIDRLVTDHIYKDFDKLLRLFPNFGNFPLSVQVALWDMIYNLGPEGLRSEFPTMLQAVRNGDRQTAALESHRLDISDERNQFVFDLFMDAAEKPDLWLLTVAALAGFATSASSETESARLGPNIGFPLGHPFESRGTIDEVLERLLSDMVVFVSGFTDCNDIVAGPLKRGTPRDSLRDTWTAVHTIRVECWAALQVDPETPVTFAKMEDLITPEIIHGIMAHAISLSAQNSEWAKALIDFSGGEITCKDAWRCRLELQDGRHPPEQSLGVNLIFNIGNDHFFEVQPMVYGKASFVYGVRWRETEIGSEVVDMFLGLE